MRSQEVCGLAVTAPDGSSDLMTDSLARVRVELRVPWDPHIDAAGIASSCGGPCGIGDKPRIKITVFTDAIVHAMGQFMTLIATLLRAAPLMTGGAAWRM